MTANECKTFRRELDEADSNHQLSSNAREHLRGCGACRSFDSDQRALRGLIASLEPVAAPSDFDFHLRARLAREKSTAGNGVGVSRFLGIPLPVAALVLLIAVAGVVVRNWMSSSTTTAVNVPPRSELVSAPSSGTKEIVSPADKQAGVTGVVATIGGSESNPGSTARHSSLVPGNRVARNLANGPRKGEASATRELGLSPAPVLGGEQPDKAGSVLRVPLDARALQISIDDGRGATRTISLPTVSFGSQRLMTSQSFMPTKATAKGVW